MMYHFIFGLAFKLSSAGPIMFCSSISCCEPSDAALARATMQHPCNDVSDSQVNQPEIQGKQKHRNNDHGGGCPDFLKAGEGYLPHFIANVGEKTFGASRKLLQPAAKAPFVAYHCCCLCHSNPAFKLLIRSYLGSGHFGLKCPTAVKRGFIATAMNIC